MFAKLLVANRGEIALRIIRACRELGVRTVSVYSDADARAPHVLAADEAVNIGRAPSVESYLRGDAIIDAARRTSAEAIHPGYGFLAEREWFARAVHEAGLIWVGPSPDAIAALGNKTAARILALEHDVPIVPGTTEPLRDAAQAAQAAAELGYPVLLKAASGGGGKGMRLVHRASELGSALEAARREAVNAFGDDAVYVEKYIDRPRHVEIQLLADSHGSVVHLGERECSIQRRHQKMIEEAPSVAVTDELRARMGEAAVRLARAAGYVNAGTCEFLLAENGEFYFLEMNTRLQVEHPVTELVTGVDVVAWQLRIAAGERLTVAQDEIVPQGWAIECRITSEDPTNEFFPSTGTVEYLRIPSGPGVRWDSGIEVGSEIGLHYDPLLAKLIVWGETRAQAVARMRRALLELVIDGVESSRDFHLRVMDDAEFSSGRMDIGWLERRLESLVAAESPPDGIRMAAVVAALLAERHRQSPPSGVTSAAGATAVDAWQRAGRRESLR